MSSSKVFFGFAVADSMFPAEAIIAKRPLTAGQVKEFIRDGVVTPCLNPSHKATIDAMQVRYGIEIEIPATAPQVSLASGDSVIVMGVRGLPRLDATRHEYTEAEIASATFTFSIYEVK